MDSFEMYNEENCLTYDDFFFFFFDKRHMIT